MTDDDDNDASRGADRGFCITMTFMMRKIRQAKVQIEAAMFMGDHGADLSSICSGSRELRIFAQGLLGIYSTPNFLFLFMIFLLIVKAFGKTIQLSQLEEQAEGADPENGSGSRNSWKKRGRAGRTGSCVRNMREMVSKR